MKRLAVLVLVALALAACGRRGAPVPPEQRVPQTIGDLSGTVAAGGIELTWTNPSRRVDGSRLRDLAVVRVFRSEDAGAGEPRPALLTDQRVAGYTEIALIRLADAAAGGTATTIAGDRASFVDRQGLVYGRRYTYVVTTEDSRGRISAPSPRVPLTFIAAPEPPANVAADAGEGEVRLRWQAPARLVDGSPATPPLAYEVLRGPTEQALERLTPAPLADTRLVDRGLENERTYHYAVRALRREGGTLSRSQPSQPVAAMPLDMTPPAAPADLVAISSAGAVRLSWKPSPDADVAAYVIYRARAERDFVRVGSIRAPATTFADREVPRGAHRYTVTAQDASTRANESPHSNVVTVTVP